MNKYFYTYIYDATYTKPILNKAVCDSPLNINSIDIDLGVYSVYTIQFYIPPKNRDVGQII